MAVSQPNSSAVIWFRRDLRVDDNGAIDAALADGATTLYPVFVIDDALWGPSGDARKSYLVRSLHDLNEQLNGTLTVVHAKPAQFLSSLGNGVAVYAAQDFGPYGMRRDALVVAAGVDLRLADSAYAVNPGTIFNLSGSPYKVFTPFSKSWLAHGWEQPYVAPPSSVWAVLPGVDKSGIGIPADPMPDFDTLPPSSTAEINAQIQRFLDGPVTHYNDDRNTPGIEGTSRLSTALKYGRVHPRTLLAQLGPSEGERVFRSELCWREFYADVLYNFPDSVRQDLNPIGELTYDTGPVADERFEAWCNGQTGYPIVDAGMRQLLAEGWIHNRVRMIVASFLVKDLHLWWKRGADWFMCHLVDGDLASNTHGWQWTAGTGTDAAPYFRVFNPTTQGMRFDADGDYIRRYVPELAHMSAPQIHEPWASPSKSKSSARSSLLDDQTLSYPKPIVDHAVERDETLLRYKQR